MAGIANGDFGASSVAADLFPMTCCRSGSCKRDCKLRCRECLRCLPCVGAPDACQLINRLNDKAAAQVLEILNDSEVRVLSENAQPMSYPQRIQAKAGEADLQQTQQQQWPEAKQDPRVA